LLFDNIGIISEVIDTQKKSNYAQQILLTHTVFNGSVNNDHSVMESKINYELVKYFNLVLSGHYHDHHQVYKNTFHLPSIQQNNFGENREKGFTILYSDLTFEIVDSVFKEYVTVEYDCGMGACGNEKLLKRLHQAVKDDVEKGKYVRLRLKGDETLLKSLNVTDLKEIGIKVEKKPNEINCNVATNEIITIDNKSMVDKFKEFCENETLDYEVGVNYLNQIL